MSPLPSGCWHDFTKSEEDRARDFGEFIADHLRPGEVLHLLGHNQRLPGLCGIAGTGGTLYICTLYLREHPSMFEAAPIHSECLAAFARGDVLIDELRAFRSRAVSS